MLRHLFTVHASLAEIELATKALDSYLQILTKGKARVEKSGEEELGLDDDATSLAAAAAGIKLLCTYGRRIEAEKAMQIAGITETWLQKLHPNSSPRLEISAGDVPKDLIDRPKIAKPEVPGNALALGFHAIGVSQACWARLTYETSSRSGLQSKAIANLRAALDPVFGEQYNIEFLYSLAYVLAEIGDLDGAICAVKEALSVGSHGPNTDGISRADFSTDGVDHQSNTHPEKRGLFLRCWHLLALLLSARQTFSTAIASCEAALELYGGKAILYGNLQPLDSLKDLEPSERKNIIEIKMTQLALAEVVDSPEEAVNASGELLGLYTKLFEYSEKPIAKTQEQRTISPQSDTNGTRTPRSFRESILGLPKDSILRSRKMGIRAENTTSNPSSYASPDDTTVPPSISVTGDAAPMPHDSKHHSHYISRHGSNKLRKRNSRKSIGSTRKSRAASPSKTFTADGSRHHGLSIGLPAHNRQVEPTAPDGPGDTPPYEINRYAADEVGVAISHDLPSMPSTPAATSEPPNPLHSIPSATQNMNHRNPNTHPVPPRPPPSQRNRPQPISTVEYAALPEPHFPPLDQSRHALTLLNKIWLLVASLYRRASMLVDAQGALSEATRHVQTIEMAIATHEGSSAESFATGGYGKLKSCGELWADVLAEQAALHVAHGNTDDASAAYEGALDHCPDHVAATIGLANILLDSYSATEPEPKSTESHAATPTLASPVPSTSSRKEISHSMPPSPPDLLARLAARDRAYGLLSALTKSGKGWDCGEAWYALARAYEESGQVEKAKEALWWVVELEEGRAVREWGCIV